MFKASWEDIKAFAKSLGVKGTTDCLCWWVKKTKSQKNKNWWLIISTWWIRLIIRSIPFKDLLRIHRDRLENDSRWRESRLERDHVWDRTTSFKVHVWNLCLGEEWFRSMYSVLVKSIPSRSIQPSPHLPRSSFWSSQPSSWWFSKDWIWSLFKLFDHSRTLFPKVDRGQVL